MFGETLHITPNKCMYGREEFNPEVAEDTIHDVHVEYQCTQSYKFTTIVFHGILSMISFWPMEIAKKTFLLNIPAVFVDVRQV